MSRAVAVLLLCWTAAAAQDKVALAPAPKLRPGVDAIPGIEGPATPAEGTINASIARQNRAIAAQFRDCDISYRQWARRMGQKRKSTRADWTRTVSVTMAGPRFLSFVVSDETFCGGAHPNSDLFALVYDLSSGKPVNWTQILQKAAASSELTAADDGTRVGMVQSAKLRAMFVAGVDAKCKDVVREETTGLVLWPDAKAEKLMVAMPQLPHAVAACGSPQGLTAAQTRELGLREEMAAELGQRPGVSVAP